MGPAVGPSIMFKLGGRRFLGAVLSVPLFVGCAATESDSGSSESDVVVGATDNLADSVAVFDDRLEYDATVENQLRASGSLEKIASEPVYFVGGRQKDALDANGWVKQGARNPLGYLRRGVSWSKGKGGIIVVKTVPATMAEALAELKKTGGFTLDTESSKKSLSPLAANGEDTDHGLGDTDKRWSIPLGEKTLLDLSGKELMKTSISNNQGTAGIVLKQGKIALNPTIDAHLHVENFIPTEVEATITSQLTGAFELEVTADGEFQNDKEGVLLPKKTWGTDKVNGLPLSLTIEVAYSCAMASNGKAKASAGYSVKTNLRTGASLHGKDLKGILDKPTFDPTPTANVNSNVIVVGLCHVIPKIELQVFDAGGPSSAMDLSARFDFDGTNAQLGADAKASVVAGYELTAGGSLRPFGFKLADIKMEPIKGEKTLFSRSFKVGQ